MRTRPLSWALWSALAVAACGGGVTDSGDGTGGGPTDGMSGSENGEACPTGTFDHDGRASTPCESWRVCEPGQYVAKEPSETENRECAACAAGRYSSSENEDACSEWSECQPGTYVEASGTSEADRLCSPCPANTFSDEENAEECSDCPDETGSPSGSDVCSAAGTGGTGGGTAGSGGSGGAGGTGGTSDGGTGGTGDGGLGGSGDGGTGGTTPNFEGPCLTAAPLHSSNGTISGASAQYTKVDTWRQNCDDDLLCPAVSYKFMANGWGPGWQSHTLTYGGTMLFVDAFDGAEQGFAPAGYPSVFCGAYYNDTSGACGLPAAIGSLTEIDTGLRWSHGGSGSDFSVAYDIWMGDGQTFAGYLMVWYRDPPTYQPAGNLVAANVYVGSDPGRWNVWTGTISGDPIVNYVRPSGEESYEYAFDALDFIEHAQEDYGLPGDTVLSMAAGFEIWNGPVSDLILEDFCVEVH